MRPGPKPKQAFACEHADAPNYARGKCRRCYMRFKAREYYPTRGRSQHFGRKYGLTTEQVESAKAAVGGKCEICGLQSKLHVDHDHASNTVRGLLCGRCNRGLGLFQDSETLLSNAVQYLRATRTA